MRQSAGLDYNFCQNSVLPPFVPASPLSIKESRETLTSYTLADALKESKVKQTAIQARQAHRNDKGRRQSVGCWQQGGIASSMKMMRSQFPGSLSHHSRKPVQQSPDGINNGLTVILYFPRRVTHARPHSDHPVRSIVRQMDAVL